MTTLIDLCTVKDVMATVTELEAGLRAQLGLNLHQAFVLCCLARGERSAGSLADELRIRQASLSRILKTLEQRGLLQRQAGEDNRHRIVSLSEAGLALSCRMMDEEQRRFPLPIRPQPFAELGAGACQEP